MSAAMRFVIPGPTKPKEAARRDPRSGRWFKPQSTREYMRTVRQSALAARPAGWPMDARYRVTLDIYFQDRRRRDVDNVSKAVHDACTGALWGDDSQVHSATQNKHLDRESPRLEVTVEVMS